MKVYVVTSQVIYDYEDYVNPIRVFANRKDASSLLRELRKEYKREYVKEDGWEIAYDNKDGFEYGMEGEYSRNSCYASIKECEVE